MRDNKVSVKNEQHIKTLTFTPQGHSIHHNNVFSPDDQWIVFDGRNDDTKIGETTTIGIVHTDTGEERELYKTTNPTQFGPGVGAASFSPIQDRVVFIHGLQNFSAEKTYAISRRTGVGIDISNPMVPIHMDARDAEAPYTAGSLRGGTHSHCWSGDGSMISFTYNDDMVDSDLRVVGVMVPHSSPIKVPVADGNNNGIMYSAIVSDVVRSPQWGSDQISKAFDECWIGSDGYINGVGDVVKYAVAFQGNTLNKKGETITEIYTVDIDQELLTQDVSAVGSLGERPHVPRGIKQRRLSHTTRGLSDLRHWLRSSKDGLHIYALAKDDQGRNQIVQCHTVSGEFKYISDFGFSIASPINISYEGDKITFVAANNVYIYEMNTQHLTKLTDNKEQALKIVGAPVFSRKDKLIAFNQFMNKDGIEKVQIKIIKL